MSRPVLDILIVGGKEVVANSLPSAFLDIPKATVLGIPYIAIVIAVVIAIGAYYLRSFRSGRELYAMGSNPDAARLAGIRVGRRVMTAFALSGALAAAALYSLASPWLAARRVDDAYSALGRNDPAGAVADAHSAHDLNPVSVDALLAWGTAEAARGNVAAAGRLYTKAISIQPDNWRPWYYRARLLENIAGPKTALFDAQQAAARDPRGLAGTYAASLATAP